MEGEERRGASRVNWLIAIVNIFMNPFFYKSMLNKATPLIFASLGGVYSETTGVVNIALEGIMLAGAFASVVFTYITGNPWIGILMAVYIGAAMGALHALACVTYRGNQIVSGTALILLSQGATGFLLQRIFGQPGSSDLVKTLPTWKIEAFRRIPFVGLIIGDLSPLVYIAFICVICSHFLIFKTKLGLRMRAVGENPESADTLGIDVYNVRYFGVIMSGILASLGGAFLSVGQLGQFTENMSNGRGFIALAAMIFGNWKPFGALGASLLFGMAESFSYQLQTQSILKLPPEIKYLFLMIPFVLTLVVVAGFVGKTRPPASDGIPYEKE